jgi:RNA polymerase sigma factor (sigma-70 family)
MPACETDMSLLRRYAEARDPAAFAEITRRYAGVVFAACHRVLSDAARAEDVSQETFFRLMRRPEAVSQSLGAWLHTAATNLAVDAVRSEAARRRREQEYAEDLNEERMAAEGEVSSWAELSPQIDEALSELAEDDRALLIAHFLQGRAQNELAAEVKTSAATMCRRIRNALEALQQKLRNRGLNAAPLALAGLLRDHGMQSVPHLLSGELGKMAMVSATRGLVRRGMYLSQPPSIIGTAAAILATCLLIGAVVASLGEGTSVRKLPASTALVFTPAPVDR